MSVHHVRVIVISHWATADDQRMLSHRWACADPWQIWIFEKVKQDQLNTELKSRETKKKTMSDQEHSGLVVIPYVERLSEATERIFRKYGINTDMNPTRH